MLVRPRLIDYWGGRDYGVKAEAEPPHFKISGRRRRLEQRRHELAEAAKRKRTGGRELPQGGAAGWYEC